MAGNRKPASASLRGRIPLGGLEGLGGSLAVEVDVGLEPGDAELLGVGLADVEHGADAQRRVHLVVQPGGGRGVEAREVGGGKKGGRKGRRGVWRKRGNPFRTREYICWHSVRGIIQT